MSTASSAARLEVEELVELARERAVRSLRGRDRTVSAALAITFFLLAVPLALAGTDRAPAWWVFPLLIGAYAVASRIDFEVGLGGSAVPTLLIFVPMLFLLPAGQVPLCVALGFGLGTVPDVVRGRLHPDRVLVPVLSSWHALGPAALVVLAGEPAASWRELPLLAAALAAQFALDFAASAARGCLVFGLSLRELARQMRPVFLVDLGLAPVAFAIAIAAADEPLAVLVALPLVGLLSVLARERQTRIDHALELSQAYRGTAFLLGDVVEADDAYTGSHSRDVVELTLAVADELELSPRDVRQAEFAALLHDVGKIRVPSEIINKPGPLTPVEREVIETHTVEGERLLARVGGLLGEVGRIVRSCHERWDGKGYPDGLAGEEIPRVARIVMCCDAFNAMTTDRTYRAALPPEEAVGELLRNSGTQFDPAVVEALVRRLGSSGRVAVPMEAS